MWLTFDHMRVSMAPPSACSWPIRRGGTSPWSWKQEAAAASSVGPALEQI